MTVAELKQALSKYPDDMKVKVNIDHTLKNWTLYRGVLTLTLISPMFG